VWRPGACPNASRNFGSSRTTARAVARRGCPLRAGRGRAEGRRKCRSDRGEVVLVRPRPEERSRDERRYVWSAGRRACRSHGTRHLQRCHRYEAPNGAPSLISREKENGRRRPSANDTTGRSNSPIRLRCLTCESELRASCAGRLQCRRMRSHERCGDKSSAAVLAAPLRKFRRSILWVAILWVAILWVAMGVPPHTRGRA
jgi:hypothetical protein